EANFEGTILSEANLAGSSAWDAMFKGASLQGTNLSQARLIGSDFTNANLFGANLTAANLREALFTGAVLAEADLRGADLTGAQLTGARLAMTIGAEAFTALLDETTTLPDGSAWIPDTDMARFTDPDHPNFWQPGQAHDSGTMQS
ncbi:MAG: pentapeptide repeat-containing protein, partial [Chloroflexota bacterium]